MTISYWLFAKVEVECRIFSLITFLLISAAKVAVSLHELKI